VVDASVAVKWYVPEEHHEAAKRLLPLENAVITPDFFPIELANALVRKVRRREIDEPAVRPAVRSASSLVRTLPVSSLIPQALDLAFQYQRNIYDSLYVALALQEGCQLVTADRRLLDAMAPSLGVLLWVEEVPV
jgi:predicted nucleic acid-binding protein